MVCVFRCGYRSARSGQFVVQFANAFRGGFQLRAECRDFLVLLLELQQERNRGMHEESLARATDSRRMCRHQKQKVHRAKCTRTAPSALAAWAALKRRGPAERALTLIP